MGGMIVPSQSCIFSFFSPLYQGHTRTHLSSEHHGDYLGFSVLGFWFLFLADFFTTFL